MQAQAGSLRCSWPLRARPTIRAGGHPWLVGLSTTLQVARPVPRGLSTGFPRSVRIAEPICNELHAVVAAGGIQARHGPAPRPDSAAGPRRVRGVPDTNKTPEGTADPVASNPDASTRVVAFVLVAPSGKTYVTGWERGCLARLSTSFEVRDRFRRSLSTGFPRCRPETRSGSLELERPRAPADQDRQAVGVGRFVREAVAGNSSGAHL